MINYKLSSLAVACALAASAPTTAFAQKLGLEARTPTAKFLEPLKLELAMRADDPRMPQFCTAKGVRCPTIVSSGRIPGGLGAPDDITSGYQHVRVSMYVQEISNVPVANGGVNADGLWFTHWLTGSSAADVEATGPFMWSAPPPGQTYSGHVQFASPSGLKIYDALAFNACGALGSFPIDHTGSIVNVGMEPYGSYSGTDATIDAAGYYNMSYTVRAEDGNGGVSDFRFGGIAVALCSGLNAL
jgi:hypothetical protein